MVELGFRQHAGIQKHFSEFLFVSQCFIPAW